MAQTHEGAEFERLLEFVRLERNFDFTGYKRSSVTGANADEFTRLLNTVLINVTSFFRDEEAGGRGANLTPSG